ncbi:hypothetical protein HUU53_02495 [Candidatus Micrarchaeota archaeon]|nr:hypothetical protein [Candidatus Micrarchaeota archaeon]
MVPAAYAKTAAQPAAALKISSFPIFINKMVIARKPRELDWHVRDYSSLTEEQKRILDLIERRAFRVPVDAKNEQSREDPSFVELVLMAGKKPVAHMTFANDTLTSVYSTADISLLRAFHKKHLRTPAEELLAHAFDFIYNPKKELTTTGLSSYSIKALQKLSKKHPSLKIEFDSSLPDTQALIDYSKLKNFKPKTEWRE